MYTRRDLISLLIDARNKLHKQELGEDVTSLDITLAHDQIDIVIDALVSNNVISAPN